VPDNNGTHETPAVKRWFLRHPEYHLPFTPASASSLTRRSGFPAEVSAKRVRRGLFKSVTALERAVGGYRAEHSKNPVRLYGPQTPGQFATTS
jgi:hypothetical protein